MIEERDKLLTLKEGLEIIKKYDDNGNLNFVNKLLDAEIDSLENSLPSDVFDELVHSNVAAYTEVDVDKRLKK